MRTFLNEFLINQTFSLHYLLLRWACLSVGHSSGIIADEMGLGKH